MSAFRTSIRRVPACAPQAANACHYATQAPRLTLFPQASEFTPLFRFLEDTSRSLAHKSVFGDARGFSPKVDIREEEQNYLIQAEVPGIEQNNINIEWADANTLTLSGHTEQKTESTSAAQTQAEGQTTEPIAASAQTNQATVEDTEDEDAPVIVPRVEEDTASGAAAESGKQAEVAKSTPASEPKYWISERSVGSFARSFKFSSRVDHDAVKASLTNGILSIVVPKAQPIQPRKINIE